jgi:hypothetical protein
MKPAGPVRGEAEHSVRRGFCDFAEVVRNTLKELERNIQLKIFIAVIHEASERRITRKLHST